MYYKMGDSTWLCLVGCSVPFSTLLTYHSADFPSATFLQVCSKNKHKTLFGFFNDGGAAVSFVCRKENHSKPASLDTIITKIKCFFFSNSFFKQKQCQMPYTSTAHFSTKLQTIHIVSLSLFLLFFCQFHITNFLCIVHFYASSLSGLPPFDLLFSISHIVKCHWLVIQEQRIKATTWNGDSSIYFIVKCSCHADDEAEEKWGLAAARMINMIHIYTTLCHWCHGYSPFMALLMINQQESSKQI